MRSGLIKKSSIAWMLTAIGFFGVSGSLIFAEDAGSATPDGAKTAEYGSSGSAEHAAPTEGAAKEAAAKGEQAANPAGAEAKTGAHGTEAAAKGEKEEKGEGHAGDAASKDASANAESRSVRTAPIAAIQAKDPQKCLVDSAAIDDLKKRREEIEAKQKELASREGELKARERALEEELKKLEATRDEISKVGSANKKEGEERVNKLVETFENMSPKGAALVMGSLDEALAVEAMSKLSTPRLAKILANMDPAKSAKLSEMMTGGSGTSKQKKPVAAKDASAENQLLGNGKGGADELGHNGKLAGTDSGRGASQLGKREPSSEKAQK